MSYYKAKQCFHDNIKVIQKPKTDVEVFIWNLSNGFQQLTQELQAELTTLRVAINHLAQDLRRLK